MKELKNRDWLSILINDMVQAYIDRNEIDFNCEQYEYYDLVDDCYDFLERSISKFITKKRSFD